ncbi:MAG TPA: phosphotransacetylase family protein [Dehalococcoidia bacterium]|nr:phosphotransacetylase family protein [Dehalococcoidia bacterium]
MVTLYVTSLAKGSGKTTVCAGIGQRLLNEGKKVGYFKVAPDDQDTTAEGNDSDAVFMQRILKLKEPLEQICPPPGKSGSLPDRVKKAVNQVSKGKDVLIIEGGNSPEIAKALKAKVIIVDTTVDSPGRKLVSASKAFDSLLLGVILNKIPAKQVEEVHSQAPDTFSQKGMNVLAVLPEDRALFTLTVGEVAAQVQGEFLNNADKSEELVENLMLGAMTVDTGPLYYGLKANKAVLLRSERSDMQLAALQTPTRCLVLSGKRELLPQVMNEAEEKEVPIIQTDDDVASIISGIEDALARNRFNQTQKLPRLAELMEQHVDFGTLCKELGLSSKK